MVFVQHYARLAGRDEELARINEFVNTRFRGRLDGAEIPTAHVIRFTKQSAGAFFFWRLASCHFNPANPANTERIMITLATIV